MAESPEYFQLDKNSYTEFSPHVVNVGDIQFKGNPDSLSKFPQWVWYTVAAPVLWGGLNNKVLSAIQQETDVTYHKKTFNKPIFAGFDSPEHGVVWNHTLWAVPQTQWPLLKSEFLAVTNVDVVSNTIIKYGLQQISIYDPLHMDVGGIASADSTMLIYAFGVMSNKKTVAFNPAQKLVERPHVYSFEPEDEIVSLGRDVLSGSTHLDGVAERVAGRKRMGE